jgi:heme exporter protein D
MQVDTLFALIILYIVLELFEIEWQKAESIMGVMVKLYNRYAKSIIWFLLLHPTYYFAIWLAMATDYSIAALAMLFIKTVDIATKILLIQQIFEKKELSQEMTLLLLAPMHPLLPYISLVVYTPMVILALI